MFLGVFSTINLEALTPLLRVPPGFMHLASIRNIAPPGKSHRSFSYRLASWNVLLYQNLFTWLPWQPDKETVQLVCRSVPIAGVLGCKAVGFQVHSMLRWFNEERMHTSKSKGVCAIMSHSKLSDSRLRNLPLPMSQIGRSPRYRCLTGECRIDQQDDQPALLLPDQSRANIWLS